MSEHVIIGLMGPAGAGKTTFADRLVSAYGFRAYNFAWPLKRLCAEQFGWDFAQLDTLAYKEEQAPGLPAGWTRRRVLQHIGTDGFRAVDPEHWVKVALRALGDLGPRIVIDDLRFPNEAAALRALGGVIVSLHRLGHGSNGHTDLAETSGQDHISERALAAVCPDIAYALPTGLQHVAEAADDLMAGLADGWAEGDARPACCPYDGNDNDAEGS